MASSARDRDGRNQQDAPPNLHNATSHHNDEDDSDEQVRQLLHRGSLEGSDTPIIDPTIFDWGSDHSDNKGASTKKRDWGNSFWEQGNFEQPQLRLLQAQPSILPPPYTLQQQQQQQQFPQFFNAPQFSIPPPRRQQQQQQQRVQWQIPMNDPFAALMSASAAAAANPLPAHAHAASPHAANPISLATGAAMGANPAGGEPDPNPMMGDATATAAAIAAGEFMKQVGQQAAPAPTNQDETICVRCAYPCSDVCILCPKRCAYHARCIDLLSIVNSQQPNTKNVHAPQDSSSVMVHSCPHCAAPASGIEILPLSFEGLDRAQKMNQGRLIDAPAVSYSRMESEDSLVRKRSNTDIEEGKSNNSSGISNPILSAAPPVASYSQSSSQCYDPTIPRTGRWTDEELAFRDSLIAHFLEGSLPLSNGLKLNDFLSNILKSKQSRLTKKMKHAKLSTKYFHIKRGFLFDNTAAREFSRLEYSFIHVITDPIERSEIQFHMQREWREHIAERCSYLRIMFDGSAWVKSVEKCDQRVALEKNRTRMVKRRWMMGKAMERDISDKVPGVFIESGAEKQDLMDGLEKDEEGDFGRFLMSMLDEGGSSGKSFEQSASSSTGNATMSMKKAAFRSSSDPNFRCSAPFLAGVTSYLEKNGIPFEHVDLWVPSYLPPGESGIGSMGSGSNLAALVDNGGDSLGACRLCFAGSATVGTQVVPDDSSSSGASLSIPSSDSDKKDHIRISPLTSDEIFNFSLYGSYSAKFSFSSGCGLPGRVHQSGVAAWEQFVSNAPSHLFERRGGAIQFGIKTALGLPIESPNVGRIVLVLYSKHNREKDEELVKQIVKDMRLFMPCPRWKLVVDVNGTKEDEGTDQLVRPSNAQIAPMGVGNDAGALLNELTRQSVDRTHRTGLSGILAAGNLTAPAPIQDPSPFDKSSDAQIRNLIALLGESMPSDTTSPLGQQINNLMSLRLVLLRQNRTPEEQQLVDTILILFESYQAAGRSRQDIALLVCRDFMFHNEQNQRVTMLQQQQQQLQQPRSLAGQQPLQSLNQQANLGMMQSSILQTLGLSQSLPSAHAFVSGQQPNLFHSNTYPQLVLNQQPPLQLQQFSLPPSYLGSHPSSTPDDQSLGTNSAGGAARR